MPTTNSLACDPTRAALMRFLLLLSCLLLSACDATSGFAYACTEEFVTIQVEVVDAFGRSIPGLSYASVNERTGEVLKSSTDAPTLGASGVYPVANDLHADRLRVDGDPIRFTASGDGVLASALFVIADDGCHVRREDGPDRITAETL